MKIKNLKSDTSSILTRNPYSFFIASAQASGLFATLLWVAVAMFGVASAPAASIPLYSFNGSDGQYPTALVRGRDGNFYGTTQGGGATFVGFEQPSYGTVFKITPGGSLTTLYSFNGSNGAYPMAGLVQGSDGDFYGTTGGGGSSDFGTVFKITFGGSLTTLHNFSFSDGRFPFAALVQGSDGDFYGTTYFGGAAGNGGTVFKITPQGSFTTLHYFGVGYGEPNADGSQPQAALVQGSDGNFYGTAFYGGPSGGGTVFRITPSGAFTMLYNFSGDSDGALPFAGLVQGGDGNFYGTTGYTNGGTVFKITPGGSLTTLYSFSGDGNFSIGGLIYASDGNFYGTTAFGGAGGAGTVFKITPGGSLTTLYSFNIADGLGPYAKLVQGIGGDLYGTTRFGGPTFREGYGDGGAGTVFKITVTMAPSNADQCKNEGWATFNSPHTFKNQGDCVQFVNTGN